MAGVFFQPRQLDALAEVDLLAYRDKCDGDLKSIKTELASLEGRRVELNKGFTLDGVLVTVGVVTAGIGIVATAIFTAGGALALIGGAASLIGAERYGDRAVERNLVSDEVKARRESIAFLNNELTRIEEEMDRRGIP